MEKEEVVVVKIKDIIVGGACVCSCKTAVLVSPQLLHVQLTDLDGGTLLNAM